MKNTTINEADMGKIQEALNHLYTDFNMFLDGEWVPDDDSVTASLELVEEIAARLNLTPELTE